LKEAKEGKRRTGLPRFGRLALLVEITPSKGLKGGWGEKLHTSFESPRSPWTNTIFKELKNSKAAFGQTEKDNPIKWKRIPGKGGGGRSQWRMLKKKEGGVNLQRLFTNNLRALLNQLSVAGQQGLCGRSRKGC